MPGMDGKGPRGTGPVGRRLGNCRQKNDTTEPIPDEQTPQPAGGNQGQGLGRGQGRGGGRGRRGGNR